MVCPPNIVDPVRRVFGVEEVVPCFVDDEIKVAMGVEDGVAGIDQFLRIQFASPAAPDAPAQSRVP